MIGKQEISQAWKAWKTSILFPLIGQPTDMADGCHEWKIDSITQRGIPIMGDRIRATVDRGKLVSTDFTSGLSLNQRGYYCGKIFKIDKDGYWENNALYKSADTIKSFIAQKKSLD